MIEFDRNDPTVLDLITHIAKVASSPTMFGDRWKITRATAYVHDLQVVLTIYDGEYYHDATVNWNRDRRQFSFIDYNDVFNCRIQYFIDRLNGLKRDEQGNMRSPNWEE